MSSGNGTHFGRSDDQWRELADEGQRFLIEQARMGRTTTYTEMNTVLRQRTSVRPFDFDLDSERAAMGHLLYLIVERERPTTGHMISAIVVYINENDAGGGYYILAKEYGELPKDATSDQKLRFWTNEVRNVHSDYQRPRR